MSNEGAKYEHIYASTTKYPFNKEADDPELRDFIKYLKSLNFEQRTPKEQKCYESYLEYSKSNGDGEKDISDEPEPMEDESNNQTNYEEDKLNWEKLCSASYVAFIASMDMVRLSTDSQNCKKFINSKINKEGLFGGFSAVYAEAKEHFVKENNNKDSKKSKKETKQDENTEEKTDEKSYTKPSKEDYDRYLQNKAIIVNVEKDKQPEISAVVFETKDNKVTEKTENKENEAVSENTAETEQLE